MNGSRTIRVIKRDGTEEAFDTAKLAGSIHRMMLQTSGRRFDAAQLALGIGIYLRRGEADRVSSSEILTMAVKVLHAAGFPQAANLLRACHDQRDLLRERLRVRHDDGQVTLWDKGWLSQLAQRSWFLSPITGRILAGEIEFELLCTRTGTISRREVVEKLNERVTQYGLADAVPVELPAAR